MNVLVTGCAGFIGSNLVDRLLKDKLRVIGIDNFNDYYDPNLKERNLARALKNKSFTLSRGDILDLDFLEKVFKKYKPEFVIHLAARAGVRPSIDFPLLYAEVNKTGTLNVLEMSRKYKVKKLVFASSSSVYGKTKRIPFVEEDLCDSIISPYGASKKAGELFVESFYKNFGLKSVILRLFTVYGPRGRVDMAPALFSRSIIRGEPILQFGDGLTYRDYTFVDDIISGIVKSMHIRNRFVTINLGNGSPVSLQDFIKVIEEIVGKKAVIKKSPMPAGDVTKTWANIDRAKKLLDWKPKTNTREGLKKYIRWLSKES